MGIPIGKLALYTAACGHPSLAHPAHLARRRHRQRRPARGPALRRLPRAAPARPGLRRARAGLRPWRPRGLAGLHHPVGGLQALQRAAHPRPLPRGRALLQRRHPGHRRGRRRRPPGRAARTRVPRSPTSASCSTAPARRASASPGCSAWPCSRRGPTPRRRPDAHRARRLARAWSTTDRTDIDATKRDFARPRELLLQDGLFPGGPIDLLETVRAVRPTILIGTTSTRGAFTEPVIRAMADAAPRPIVMPLSNPTSASRGRSGGHPGLDRWPGARSRPARPFAPIESRRVGATSLGQGNNVFIFPGVGLGTVVAEVRTIPDTLFLAAAHALAGLVTAERFATGRALPPGRRPPLGGSRGRHRGRRARPCRRELDDLLARRGHRGRGRSRHVVAGLRALR